MLPLDKFFSSFAFALLYLITRTPLLRSWLLTLVKKIIVVLRCYPENIKIGYLFLIELVHIHAYNWNKNFNLDYITASGTS